MANPSWGRAVAKTSQSWTRHWMPYPGSLLNTMMTLLERGVGGRTISEVSAFCHSEEPKLATASCLRRPLSGAKRDSEATGYAWDG